MMDWSNSQLFDNTSFDSIQTFFKNNPVGSIGAKLLSTSTSSTTTTTTLPNQNQMNNQMNKSNSIHHHHHHHHQNNPSPPESIPSPCSSLNQSHQITSNPTTTTTTTTTHPKRKTSSSSSSALKDRKESSSQKKSPTRSHSDQSTVEHTHEGGSEPSDNPEPKGVGKLKRKEQNRNAQRAFRERKERRLQELQDQVDELLAKQEPLTTENKHLKELVNRLQTENQSLGVYKEAFTFTIANDLRRSSMPISKRFDQESLRRVGTNLEPLGIESLSDRSQEVLEPNPLLKPALRGNQENLNRLGLSLPTTTLPDRVNHDPIPNPNQARVVSKAPTRQTPRNSLSNGNGATYTPPLSSSSSLASFLNTNHTPVEGFSEENRAYVFDSSSKLAKPMEKFDASFPSYTSSPMPRNPMVAFNVNQPDPPLLPVPEQVNQTDLNTMPTFTAASGLNFGLLPSNQSRSGPAESDSNFWNSYLNFELPNDKLNLSQDLNPIENIKPNEVQFSKSSTNELGFQSFNPLQERSFTEYSLKDLDASDLPLSENIDLFSQWRSPETVKDGSFPSFGIQSFETQPDLTTTAPQMRANEETKKTNEDENSLDGLSKFVDEGVLSNQELDGLCEMLQSKATCKEKSELMKDVVAIRPEWSGLIEDITRKARSRCAEGLRELELEEEEGRKKKKQEEEEEEKALGLLMA